MEETPPPWTESMVVIHPASRFLSISLMRTRRLCSASFEWKGAIPPQLALSTLAPIPPHTLAACGQRLSCADETRPDRTPPLLPTLTVNTSGLHHFSRFCVTIDLPPLLQRSPKSIMDTPSFSCQPLCLFRSSNDPGPLRRMCFGWFTFGLSFPVSS